jgi:hypothetical protein
LLTRSAAKAKAKLRHYRRVNAAPTYGAGAHTIEEADARRADEGLLPADLFTATEVVAPTPAELLGGQGERFRRRPAFTNLTNSICAPILEFGDGTMSKATTNGRVASALEQQTVMFGAVERIFALALEQARRIGGGVRFTVDVAPTGETVLGPIAPVGVAQTVDESTDSGTSLKALDRSLASAHERGRSRVAGILAGEDMLSADAMAELLGTTRMTVNARRRNHQLLGLEGAKRGVRYPRWQIGRDGKPFEALPALFERLGGSPWAVYRFLVQHHAELGGLTGREALARGRATDAIEAADSVAEAFS